MLDGFSQYGYDSSQVSFRMERFLLLPKDASKIVTAKSQATDMKRGCDQIQKFFNMGDADKDSALTFQEFLAGREGMQSKMQDGRCRGVLLR